MAEELQTATTPAEVVSEARPPTTTAAAAAEPSADGDAPATKKRKVEDADAVAPPEHRRLERAHFFYYLDMSDTKQGPFFPGPMRDWLQAGFFTAETKVAPSFGGEVPRLHDFRPASELFDEPLADHAFKAVKGIAQYPVQEVPQLVVTETESSEAPKGPFWLNEKLEAIKRGEVGSVGGGPVLKGSFVN